MTAPAHHRRALTTAIALALALPTLAAYAQSDQRIVADGTQEIVTGRDYGSDADGAAGYVLHALNGGAITAADPVNLVSGGANTAAVHAETGGSVVLNGGDIRARGDNANGLSVASGGTVEANVHASGQPMQVTTTGNRASAALVNDGTLILRGTALTTLGDTSHGIQVSNKGHLDMTGGTIRTNGGQSHGISVQNATAVISDVTIETSAHSSSGIYLGAGSGRLEGDRVNIISQDSGAIAQLGTTLELRDSRIEVTGGSGGSSGVAGAADITLTNTDIVIGNEGSYGLQLSGGTFTMHGGSISALAARSQGIALFDSARLTLADLRIDSDATGIHLNGSGNTLDLHQVDIHAHGNGSGVALYDDNVFNMTGGSVRTEGAGHVVIDNRGAEVNLTDVSVIAGTAASHGLYASRDGHARATFLGERVNVETQGTGAIGAIAREGGAITLRDSNILTSGDKAYGVLTGGAGALSLTDTNVRTQGLGAWAAVVNGNGSLDINGGALTSDRAGALWVRTARHVSARNGARLIGGDGTLMAVDAAANRFTLALDQDVYAKGDIVITPEDIGAGIPVVADIHLDLNRRSHWQGATSVVNSVSLANDSRWTLTGDSTVQRLKVSNSTLELSANGAGFNTLTVDGNLDTENALLIFNGALGGDDSLTDRLHVRGSTNGTAAVQVNNVHGLGGQTIDGIQLIQIDGASNGDYHLQGRAVAGRYEYFLHKGGIGTTGAGGWFLRSELGLTPPDPCEADPTGPGCGEPPLPPDPCELDPSGPSCGDETVLPPDPCEVDPDAVCGPRPPQVLRPELGAYLANQAAAVSMFRLGMDDLAAREGSAPGTAWVRTSGQYSRSAMGGQLALKGRQSVLQAGVDLAALGQARGGVMLATGHASHDVRSAMSGYTATGTVKGTAAGLYGTWRQHDDAIGGLRVGAWWQQAHYRNAVQGVGLAKERYDARSTAASVELARAWALKDTAEMGLYIEPQVQLVYTRYRADQVVEHNGTRVSVDTAGGLASRVGLRLFGRTHRDGNGVQPFLAVNWLHEGRSNSVWFDDERMAGALPRHRHEVQAGARIDLTPRWSLSGDLSLQRGDGGYRSAAAQLGLKASW
jgi:autotransporter family porin